MSDYRDDRAALHARLEQQQRELSELRTENKKLRVRADHADELERQIARLGPQPAKGQGNPAIVLAAVAAVMALGVGAGAFFMLSRAPAQVTVSAPVVAAPPPAVTATPPVEPATPRGFEALTCRCDGATLSYSPGATMSFGAATTHYVSWSLTGGSGEPRPLATGPRTVPADKIEGGEVVFRVACTKEAMVLALDQRATAWSLADGHELWTSPLPSPVGKLRGGALTPKCEALTVDAAGNVVVPHAAGKTVLRGKDGELVR